jgi:hypothetical protein
MNRGASLFLRAVLVLIGIGALAFLLWEPQAEGVHAHSTFFQIYFQDPFVAFAYIGSIPFFVGLYQAIKVLGRAGRSDEFSPSAVKSLRTIKYCALLLIGFVVVGEVFIMMQKSDDRAGGVMMGVAITFCSIVVATAMAVLERSVQQAADIKSEHDLTV